MLIRLGEWNGINDERRAVLGRYDCLCNGKSRAYSDARSERGLLLSSTASYPYVCRGASVGGASDKGLQSGSMAQGDVIGEELLQREATPRSDFHSDTVGEFRGSRAIEQRAFAIKCT